jgi:hypothetical protein
VVQKVIILLHHRTANNLVIPSIDAVIKSVMFGMKTPNIMVKYASVPKRIYRP